MLRQTPLLLCRHAIAPLAAAARAAVAPRCPPLLSSPPASAAVAATIASTARSAAIMRSAAAAMMAGGRAPQQLRQAGAAAAATAAAAPPPLLSTRLAAAAACRHQTACMSTSAAVAAELHQQLPMCSSSGSGSTGRRQQQPLAAAGQPLALARGRAHQQHQHQQRHQQHRRGARCVASSAAAAAPVIKQAWDTDAARAALSGLADEPAEFARGVEVLDSIVKVFTVYSRPDYFLPWQNHPKRESTGTGFVIRDRLILTNAHVVADQTYVTVKRHGSGTKYRADVVAVGHDVDLALLTVEDDEFWTGGGAGGGMSTSAGASSSSSLSSSGGDGDEANGGEEGGPTAAGGAGGNGASPAAAAGAAAPAPAEAAAAAAAASGGAAAAPATTFAAPTGPVPMQPMKPLQLGDVPQLQEQVLVVGYPTGGDNTSITSGVVSRVEVTQYVHAASHLMAIQIDAAINPGNSGGPALRGDVVVGVAFQNLPHADNIGYIIPLPVVRRFLSEVVKHGRYRGFCSLGIVFQTMDNTHLRRALGMGAGQSGVLVNRIQPTTSTAAALRKGDVLMEFDGVPIANDGTVHFRARERIFFTSLITQKPTGSTAHVKVLRDGAPKEYDLVLEPLQTLVPVHRYDQLPSYFIYAGLVFVPLSQPYLHEYGDDWMSAAPRRLVDKALNSLMSKPGQQVIVLSQVLVDDVNTGYQQFQNLQVLRVNGVEVLNLQHLKQLIAGGGGGATEAAAAAAAAHAGNSSSNGAAASSESSSTTSSSSSTSTSSSSTSGPDWDARFLRLELEDDRVIVMERPAADAATERLQRRYRVPYLSSADLA